MKPEQNQQPAQPPTTPPSSADKPKKSLPKWIWLAAGGVLVLFIGGIWLALSLLMSNSRPSSNNGQANSLTKLTIGSEPYVYPCSVATEADYARIFALDDTAVGTASETSALAAKNIKAATSDLTKIAPAVSDRYTTSCAYTLAKKGASSMSRIEIKLIQFSSEDEASKSYASARSSDAGDFTRDNVDNGTRQLSKLPSFPDSSYVRLPEPDSILPGLKATFVSGSHLITLEYNFAKGETSDSALPRVDEYAKTIQTKLNAHKESKPLDLTGRDAFIGKKFVDACQRTDLSKLGGVLGNLEFRPDEADFSNTYGSLTGSRAAEDGAVSHCDFGFNTPGDRQAQATLKQVEADSSRSARQSTPSLTAAAMWPHTLNVTVNSYRTANEAKASLAAKKQRASNVIPNSGAPVIEDVAGVGDGAYMYHRETSLSTLFNGESTENVSIDDMLVVASGGDVITVSLRQSSENSDYKTAPVEANEAQFKKAYELVRDTITANR